MSTLDSVVTFGQICEAIGEREHRVRYALGKLNEQPIRRCGNALVWPAEIVVAVRAELAAIDARRGKATTTLDEC